MKIDKELAWGFLLMTIMAFGALIGVWIGGFFGKLMMGLAGFVLLLLI